MLYPDLMLTKTVALRRQEQQRRLTDPHADAMPARVVRGRRLPAWLRRVQFGLADHLVSWGKRLQSYSAPPPAPARSRSSQADCFETIQVRR